MELINDPSGGDASTPSEKNDFSPFEPASSRATNLGLAPILAKFPIEEFRQFGVAPVAYDQADRQLKLVARVTIDEPLRQLIASRLPDVKVDWYQVDDRVYAFMLGRLEVETPSLTGAVPPTAGPEQSLIDIVPATPEPVSGAAEVLPSKPVPQEVPSPAPEERKEQIAHPGQKSVVFVTPTGRISQHLMFAFTAEHITPVTVKNLDQAVAALEQHPAAAVFIHENLHGRSEQMLSRMQATLPDVPVRFFRSEASLLVNDTRDQATFDLVRQNLTLYGRLNSAHGSALSDHAATVARFADRMAVRLAVSDHCRLMIQTAAFLHNMAEETLSTTDGLQQADIIRLSASRLESWGFPPLVIRMLKRMYLPVGENGMSSEGVEATGGYILTAADAFCHMWPDTATAGRQMEVVQRRLEDSLQWKVMPSVISTLIDVICDDCTARLLRPNRFHVHLFVSRGQVPASLTDTLRDSEFDVSLSTNVGECVQKCRQAKADLLVIHDSGSVTDVYDTMMSLALRGVAIDQLHAVLLLDEEVIVGALRLLPHGVEEILPMAAQPQAILTKLLRIKNRLEEQYRYRVSAIERLGTHGSLSDMCLTDILEIWRGNRRPARISVTAFGNQLTVYLDKGKVVAADCGECEGISALLRGVSWRQGIWNIDSIEPSELPEPNVDQSVDAVLIEACTRIDEVGKDEPAYAGSSRPGSF